MFSFFTSRCSVCVFCVLRISGSLLRQPYIYYTRRECLFSNTVRIALLYIIQCNHRYTQLCRSFDIAKDKKERREFGGVFKLIICIHVCVHLSLWIASEYAGCWMGCKGVWLAVIAVDVSSGIVYLLFSAFDFNAALCPICTRHI